MTSRRTSEVEDKLKLRAIHDFDPRQMSKKEKRELTFIFERTRVIEQTGREQRYMLDQSERHQNRFERHKMRRHGLGLIEYNRQMTVYEDNNIANASGPSRRGTKMNPDNEMKSLEDKAYSGREEKCESETHQEAIKIEDQKTVMVSKDLQHTSYSDERSDAEEMKSPAAESHLHSVTMSCCAYDPFNPAEDEEDLYAAALSFNRGDNMEALPPENCSDTDGWLIAWHTDNGKIGYIPKNRVVIEEDCNRKDEHKKVASGSMLYDLPLEMLDIILQKSCLHWILNSSPHLRDEEVIRSLISVDVCFNRIVTGHRFERTLWCYLKDYYGKTKKRSAIIRVNRNYLLENLDPSDELIASMLSLSCITEEESHVIKRQRFNRDKNAELFYMADLFDHKKFSNFVRCLQQTNQKTVAKILENGGGVIRINAQMRGANYATSIEAQLFQKKLLAALRNRGKPRSQDQSDRWMDENIEILDSQLDRQTVVVWIWCRSQAALQYIQRLYSSHQLRDALFESIRPSMSAMINIDSNQFRETVVMFSICINFTRTIGVGRNEIVCGVTTLRNAIYMFVVCERPSTPNVIRVFDDQNPFSLRKKIEVKQIEDPVDIGSSEKENCLYICDYDEKCIWKIAMGTNDRHEIVRFLSPYYKPRSVSVTSDGQLLLTSYSSSNLWIYGSDAELIRSIQLPSDIEKPRIRRAVESSVGNFIILHETVQRDEEGLIGRRRKGEMDCGLCELTRDGQMVIRRFESSNEAEKLRNPSNFSLDSDDRVFVADNENQKVTLFDSDLKWNRFLCSTNEEEIDGEPRIQGSLKLCYDKEKKQLIVGGFSVGDEINVYTLERM